MTTPAEELRAAAFQLRNPFHAPGLKIGIDPDLGAPLADWLESTATSLSASTHPGWQECVAPDALAVARAINGTAS
jgi:hypothetical protein